MPESVKTQSDDTAKTILFVEDDPISLALYQDALENEGFHLECAQDGLAAFKILTNFVPDLVLLDLILPRFSGVHVIKYMQADPRLATVPVIILSNAALTEIVPPDSPLSPVVQGTRKLLKGDCNFTTLLRTIRECLAAPRPVIPPGQLSMANLNMADGAEDLSAPGRGNTPNTEARTLDAVILASSLKATLKEKEAKMAQLEEDLAKLRKVQDDSQGKVKADQQQSVTKYQQECKDLQKRLRESTSELEILKTGLKHQTGEWARLESELRDEMEAAKASAGENEGAIKEKEARCSQLEQELSALRKARDEFQAKLTAEQQTAAKAQSELKELQDRLTLSKTDLDRAKTTLEQQLAERRRLEAEWKEQIKATKVGVGETEAVLKEKVEWCDELEKEFAALQDTAEKSQEENKQFQERLTQAGKELEQAKAAAEQQLAERKRLEADWCKQLDTAKAAAGQTDAVLKEKMAWCDELEKELAAFQQNASKSQKENRELQERLAQAGKDLAQASKELAQAGKELEQGKAAREQLTAERARLEADWRKQLDATRVAADRTEAALKEKAARCGQLEREIAGLQQEHNELQDKLKAGQQVTEKAQRELKELQERLSRANIELDRRKAILEQHAAERKRFEAEWEERMNVAKAMATQQAVEKAGVEIKELQERLTQARVEAKKVKASMDEQLDQVTRLEAENRALAETKRTLSLGMTRMRESQISREAELADRQKKLVEALREGALLLQARLQEACNGNGAPTKYEMPPVPTEPPPAPNAPPRIPVKT